MSSPSSPGIIESQLLASLGEMGNLLGKKDRPWQAFQPPPLIGGVHSSGGAVERHPALIPASSQWAHASNVSSASYPQVNIDQAPLLSSQAKYIAWKRTQAFFFSDACVFIPGMPASWLLSYVTLGKPQL